MTVEEAALAGIATGVVIVNVVLIRTGHPPLSSAIRRSPWLRRAAKALAAHVTEDIPFDPLTALGRAIAPKET